MQTPEKVLKHYFGYDGFRPMQREIIETVLNNRDCVVLMPTGGGKSVCFQVPAILKEGTAIVISPLIALMHDQVSILKSNGVSAAYLNSSLSGSELNQIEKDVLNGKLKLLYVSPEKLLTNSFMQLLKSINISLFAIDEAHCISAWGHDFRPEYTQLRYLKNNFPAIPIVALTATADRTTRKDIAANLNLQNPEIFVSSFNRPNLSLNVQPGLGRLKRILEFLGEHPKQSGIIYCLSRKSTEEIAAKLTREGYSAAAYHAGMEASERRRVQDAFIKDDLEIICATIAFGMGIDKPNVRFVIHYNLPKNLESFYQEIGRAGRDGLPSDTLLFYSYSDVISLRDMLANAEVPLPPERLELVLAKLDRMKQYAEANQCRRRILISYFSEDFDKNCGNCDVCKNPRKVFDGTIVAQKALSGVMRTNQNVSIPVLIDILRGSRNLKITEKGYENIKTFGVGRDISVEMWREYLQQLVNMGYIEIAYDEAHALKATELTRRVLFENYKVHLVQPEFKDKTEKKAADEAKYARKPSISEEIFERLRILRKSIADKENVPPYVVFSDAVLQEMSEKKPMNELMLLQISGIGEVKLRKYGKIFLQEILKFVAEKTEGGKVMHGTSHLITWNLYQEGKTVDEIAQLRNLGKQTITSHFAALYEQDYKFDVKIFLSKEDYFEILAVLDSLENFDEKLLKPISEALEGKFDYGQIRFAIAIRKKSAKKIG